MKIARHYSKIIIGVSIMLFLIMDTETATRGAAEGIEQCIRVIIPSLFPFMVVSTYLNTALLGHKIPVLHMIAKKLNMPIGGESILLLGLTGGYPVGAQLVTQACLNNQISKRMYRILLGYCNNAGPAFIFGIAGSLFTSRHIPMMLWGIHMLSALITGFLLPRPDIEVIHLNTNTNVNIMDALKKSISVCVTTCGWIIIFKILLSYLNTWLSIITESPTMIIVSGFLELSNGCLQLKQVISESIRFILCSAFLSFGGICVLLQTSSVTAELGLGLYIPGKIIQTAISTIFTTLLSSALFPFEKESAILNGSIILLCASILLISIGCLKKDMVIQKRIQYN